MVVDLGEGGDRGEGGPAVAVTGTGNMAGQFPRALNLDEDSDAAKDAAKEDGTARPCLDEEAEMEDSGAETPAPAARFQEFMGKVVAKRRFLENCIQKNESAASTASIAAAAGAAAAAAAAAASDEDSTDQILARCRAGQWPAPAPRQAQGPRAQHPSTFRAPPPKMSKARMDALTPRNRADLERILKESGFASLPPGLNGGPLLEAAQKAAQDEFERFGATWSPIFADRPDDKGEIQGHFRLVIRRRPCHRI